MSNGIYRKKAFRPVAHELNGTSYKPALACWHSLMPGTLYARAHWAKVASDTARMVFFPLKFWLHIGVTGRWQTWSPNLTSQWPWRCSLVFCGIVAAGPVRNPAYLKLFDDFDVRKYGELRNPLSVAYGPLCQFCPHTCEQHIPLHIIVSLKNLMSHHCSIMFHLMWNHGLSIIYYQR